MSLRYSCFNASIMAANSWDALANNYGVGWGRESERVSVCTESTPTRGRLHCFELVELDDTRLVYVEFRYQQVDSVFLKWNTHLIGNELKF